MLYARFRCIVAALAAVSTFTSPTPLFADHLTATSIPAGYTSSSLEIGVPFGGAIAKDTVNANRLYVSVAEITYGPQKIVAVDASNGTTTTVSPSLGTIGGMACLTNGDLVFTENYTSDSIFRAHDGDADGDFLDPGEITQLISPILADGNFTGTWVAVAPGGGPSAIPAGSVVVQTADGGTSSELLVIQNPATSPSYRPRGGAFYSGYQYNGGIAFDAAGDVVCGISQFNFSNFTSSGRIVGLVDTNADGVIGPGESNLLVGEADLTAGLSDLAVSAEHRVFFGENSGAIRTFTAPANLLSGSATPSVFANTNALYLSVLRFDAPQNSFAPNAGANSARLYVGGFASYPNAATNLLVIQPTATSAVSDWQLY